MATAAQVRAQDERPKLEHPVPRGHAGGKVTVACKLPNGLRLQLHEAVEVAVPVLGGGVKVVKEYRPVGEPITVAGWRGADGKPKLGTVAGCGITHNVPADFWNQWLKENKEQAYVRNGLIFAYEKADHVEGQAREEKDRKSGLEPLNMGRKFKTVNGSTRSVPVDPRVPSKIRTRTERDDDGGEE